MNPPGPPAAQQTAANASRVSLLCKAYPSVNVDGKPVPLKLKRGLALIVYLFEAGRKVARSQLAGLLWPDTAPETGRARLRRLAHETNGVLGLPLLTGDADAVWLADAGLTSDVGEVRASAQQLLAQPADPASSALVETLVRVDAHRLLEGFSLHNDSFDSWLDVKRGEQERLVARALSRAAEHLCSSGQPDLAALAASQLIAIDPLSDAGHTTLLTARALLGDAAGVEAAYFACAEVLRQELGIRPSTQIEAAYQEAQQQLSAWPAPRAPTLRRMPPIRFADTSDGAVAYLELGSGLGSGAQTLIMLFGLWSHIEVAWEEPGIRATLDRLARRYRVVLMDRRGTGLSERLALQQSVVAGVEDLDAVRRAIGVERVWILGNSMGGTIGIEYTATHPDHVAGLVLYGAGAKGTWAPDYPWALTHAQLESWLVELRSSWGRSTSLARFAPSMAEDGATRDWWARMLRQSASKNSIPSLVRAFAGVDVRARLAEIKAPTLIIQRQDDGIVRAACAVYLSQHIAKSRLVMLPGADHPLWYGDTAAVLDEVERFIG
jgi:pimeloyl-ACP methyl ester carboxylesterase/DNA-binding SARP family transcriptional activator